MATTRRRPTFWQATAGFMRLVRWPNLVILVLTQYLTRVFLIGDQHLWREYLIEKELFLLAISTVMIAAAGYIINDYYDIKIDLLNKPQRVIIGRYVKRRVAMGAHQVLNLLGVGIGLYLSKKIFLVNLFAVFCLWFYSNQLKRMPFWGNLMIAILAGLSLVVLAVYYGQHEQEVYIYATFAFSISLIREIIKDLEDMRGDASFGCQTLPIRWGVARTKWFLYVLIGVFMLLLGLLAQALQNTHISVAFGLMLFPTSYLIYRIFWADTLREFAFLSHFCKIIMLAGVLSMMLI
jgi:4-hydroxybenzoate polyprenyltransferase